jgi:hypothetical protein
VNQTVAYLPNNQEVLSSKLSLTQKKKGDAIKETYLKTQTIFEEGIGNS